MKVTINLDKNIFPKLFNYNGEELNNIILNLINKDIKMSILLLMKKNLLII